MSTYEKELAARVGKRIRAYREAMGLTQADLAAVVGLVRTSMTNVEAGRQEIPLRRLALIAEFLGTTVTNLCDDTPLSDLHRIADIEIKQVWRVYCEDHGYVDEPERYPDAVRARRDHYFKFHASPRAEGATA